MTNKMIMTTKMTMIMIMTTKEKGVITETTQRSRVRVSSFLIALWPAW